MCIFVICSVVCATAVHSLLSLHLVCVLLTGCCRNGWMIPAPPPPVEPGKLALVSVEKIADNRRNFTFKATRENPLVVTVVVSYVHCVD